MSSNNRKFFLLIGMFVLLAIAGCTDRGDDKRVKDSAIEEHSETTTIEDSSVEESSETTTIAETTETTLEETESSTDGPDVSIYEGFLAGNVKADCSRMDEFPVYIRLDNREINQDGYTLTELTTFWDEVYTQYKDTWTYEPALYYAYIDCGGDGQPELAVKYENLNIYSEGDDSSNVMIFGKEQDKIKLIYAYETWARSSTEMGSNGLITSFGSSGAASHSSCEAYIDAAGELKLVERVDYEGVFEAFSYYEELGLLAENIVNSDIDVSALEVIMLKFGEDEEYYTSFQNYNFDENDSSVYSEGEYYELFTNSDLNYVTPDEIEEMYQAQLQKLNLNASDFDMEANAIDWIKIEK